MCVKAGDTQPVVLARESGPQAVVNHLSVTSNQAGRYDMVQGPGPQGAIPARDPRFLRDAGQYQAAMVHNSSGAQSAGTQLSVASNHADLGEVDQGPTLQGTIPAHATRFLCHVLFTQAAPAHYWPARVAPKL